VSGAVGRLHPQAAMGPAMVVAGEGSVFGDQGSPGGDEGQDEVEQEAKEADHGSDRVPRWSVSGTAGVRAGQDGRTRGESRIGGRAGPVTVGDTG
jgi:hypothetical protein